jgi:hypothetical protein
MQRQYYAIKTIEVGTNYIILKSQAFKCISFHVRNYSSSKICVSSPPAVPRKTYKNVNLDKLLILQENKNKAGVYR